MRICLNCGLNQQKSSFCARQRGKDYFSKVCISCRQAQQRVAALRYHHANPIRARAKRSAYRALHSSQERESGITYRKRLAERDPSFVVTPQEKQCGKCRITKQSDQYGRKKAALNGLRRDCKECERNSFLARCRKDPIRRREIERKSYLAHTERHVRRNAKWMRENRDRRSQYTARYQTENAARIGEYGRKYYVKHKATINEQSKEWRRNNPESVLGFSHARRARIAGQGGRYSKQDIERIFAAQREKCAVCRVKLGTQFHRDHIIPISSGGSNAARNIQLLCGTCNRSKHAKDPITFMQERGFLI